MGRLLLPGPGVLFRISAEQHHVCEVSGQEHNRPVVLIPSNFIGELIMKKSIAAVVAVLCLAAVCSEAKADHRSSRSRSNFGITISLGRGFSASFGQSRRFGIPHRHGFSSSGRSWQYGIPYSYGTHTQQNFLRQHRSFVFPQGGYYHNHCY